MARGLHESHGWTSTQIADYLAQVSWYRRAWRRESIEDLSLSQTRTHLRCTTFVTVLR